MYTFCVQGSRGLGPVGLKTPTVDGAWGLSFSKPRIFKARKERVLAETALDKLAGKISLVRCGRLFDVQALLVARKPFRTAHRRRSSSTRDAAGHQRQEFYSATRYGALVWRSTQLLVQRDNSLPGTAPADFAPLGSVALASAVVASEGRLGQ
jgi:hypothetical protein